MSKEKQMIEEMAKDLIESHSIDAWAARVHGEAYTDYNATARKLIANGWQKQSEGEWIWTENGTEDYEQYWLCSCCNNKSYWKSKFCEECGAKMKGGAE